MPTLKNWLKILALKKLPIGLNQDNSIEVQVSRAEKIMAFITKS